MDDINTAISNALKRSKAAVESGRYEDALRDHQWIHEQTPRRSVLRLSYGLGGWCDLAELYPPAMDALTATRDRDTARLLAGEEESHLFDDVATINTNLGQPAATRDLFAHLDRSSPAFAATCERYARPALAQCKDYALARRYLPDIDQELTGSSFCINRSIKHDDLPPVGEDPGIYAEVHNYAKHVRIVLEILNGCDESEAAAKIRHAALMLVSSPQIRARVETEIDFPGTTWAMLSDAHLDFFKTDEN